MIRSLYIAKTGMDAQQTQMDIISNNLANVSTTGFKGSRAVFEDLIYQTLRQPGAQSSQQSQIPTGLQIGTGVQLVSTERLQTQGNVTQTSNPYDMAIQGAGFFQVLMPDGTTSYTRDVSFTQNNQGTLVTSSGYPLQPAITVPANATNVTIGTDGTVTMTSSGSSTPVTIGSIQLAMFINPTGLQSQGQNLYQQTASSGAPTVTAPGTNAAGTLNQGFVESSNVNVVEELVNMITSQRAYEINSKAITASDQMLQKIEQM
jgi:flagellar basal-body rod protein FlgG